MALTFTITVEMPMNPMPSIHDEDDYLHGNGNVNGVLEGYGQFYFEFVTEARANVPAGLCYDQWVVVGNPEVYRYKFDSASNSVIMVSQSAPTELVVYWLGHTDELPEDEEDRVYFPTVSVNGEEIDYYASVGPSTDSDVFPGWPTPPFPRTDVQLSFHVLSDRYLPVFSFRPNWSEPVPERLSFLTDVLRAAEGAEQRRSLRETPRRSTEIDFLLTGPERAFWDLFMNRLGGTPVMLPFYWDIVTLSAATVANTTDRIDFDNTHREFAVGLAILMGKTAMDYEVVQIASMDDNGIDLTDPVARSWPRGTKLLPLRRGLLDDVGDLTHKTAGVATVTASMIYTRSNPWTPADDDSLVYGGLPVFLYEPNWADDLTVTFDRDTVRFDTNVGLIYQVDPLNRSLAAQAHRWFLVGRENLARFRDLIYRHRGRAGSFWLPTFKADLRLVNSPGSAATQIEVDNVGYGYTGGPTSGREYIAIKHSAGTILRKILSVVPGSTSKTEKLNLDAPLGLALSPGLVLRISFLDVARFDTDDFEITHHAGLDSLHEINATFRNVKNTRTAPQPISFPIPAGFQSNAPCGYGAGVLNIDANSFTNANANSGGLILESGSTVNYLVVTKPRVADTHGLLTWDAYSLWPADDGGGQATPVPGQTWNNQFRVYGSNGGGETLLYNGAGMSANYYTDADAAYAAVSALLPKIFTGYLRYRITCIVDDKLGDNRAGLSLLAYVTNNPAG